MKIKFYPTKDCTQKNNVNGLRYTKSAYSQLKDKIKNAILKKHCVVNLPSVSVDDVIKSDIQVNNIYGFVESVNFQTSEVVVKPLEQYKDMDISGYSLDTFKYATIEDKVIKDISGFAGFILRLNSEFKNAV